MANLNSDSKIDAASANMPPEMPHIHQSGTTNPALSTGTPGFTALRWKRSFDDAAADCGRLPFHYTLQVLFGDEVHHPPP